MTSDDRRTRRGFRLTIRCLAIFCAYILVIYLIVYPIDHYLFYRLTLGPLIIPTLLWVAWHLDFPARFRDRVRELDQDPPEPKP
jgi:hypothetical protein